MFVNAPRFVFIYVIYDRLIQEFVCHVIKHKIVFYALFARTTSIIKCYADSLQCSFLTNLRSFCQWKKVRKKIVILICYFDLRPIGKQYEDKHLLCAHVFLMSIGYYLSYNYLYLSCKCFENRSVIKIINIEIVTGMIVFKLKSRIWLVIPHTFCKWCIDQIYFETSLVKCSHC